VKQGFFLVTIKDIAVKAGVSIGTVDRVLHGRGRVSKKTAETIKTIVKKTGYRTNIHARNLSLKQTVCIGVIMPFTHQDSNYWDILKKGIDQAIKDLASFSIKVHYYFFDKYSERSFCDAADKALKAGVQGFLITPVLADACPHFVNAIPGDIPYVYVDSMAPDTKPLSYIGQDSFQSGLCGAKLMHVLTGGKGNIAIIRMLPNDYHINERVRGFLSYFEKISSITVKAFDVSGSRNEQGFEDYIHFIDSKFSGCTGYFVTYAETHRVAKALQKMSKNKKFIIGYDLVDENVRLVQDHVIDFIISQKTREQGYKAINMLFRNIVLKETCEREILMPIDIITAENLRYYQ
jgi:LacI family transcriptional regulator